MFIILLNFSIIMQQYHNFDRQVIQQVVQTRL